MATAAKTREKLTIRDGVDLYIALNRYVEEHVDEIELNDGALPDDFAQLLDEVDVAMIERVDAFAAKIDEFTGYAATAKATKDRAARREKVWNNISKSMKAYALLQVQRNGGAPIKGASATLRVQRNGQPSTECAVTSADLLAISDSAYNGVDAYDDPSLPEGSISAPTHPLLPYITVVRVATLDMKAIAAAHEARRAELEAEAAVFSHDDLAQMYNGPEFTTDFAAITPRDMRARYVADNLAAEFPGVRCIRGEHLRID